MGCYSDYETRNIVCIMPTGAGKSTFFEALGCWIPAVSPGSMLYASQTDTDAELWKETRYMKAAVKCKPLDHLWPSNLRNAVRKDAIIWPHMFQVFGGANRSNFQEKSITYGMGDEAWIWKPGMVKEWLARSHNRENRKFVLASQAGVVALEGEAGETCELHQEFAKCRQWDFGWKCKCGSIQPFEFSQLRYNEVKREDGRVDDQLSADTTRRVCPSCGEEYADTPQVRRMLHDSLQENDGYILTSDEGRRGYEGFHLDRGGMWWCSWSDDVLKKLTADRQNALGDSTGLMEWNMKDRAKGWSASSAVVQVELKRSGYTEGDYAEARKIDGEQCRFLTADAGLDHWWVTVRAWANGGSSRLLFFGYVGRESELSEIEAKYNVQKNCCFMDVGYQQTEIAEVIARLGWRGIKGKSDTGDNITHLFDWEIKTGSNSGKMEQRLYSKRKITKAKSGKSIEYFHVSTEKLQYILQRLIDGQGAEWLAYDDAPPSYAKHLNGERLAVLKSAKGRDIKKWTRSGANHGRDCEIYNLAAAFMFKVFRPSIEDLEQTSENEN